MSLEAITATEAPATGSETTTESQAQGGAPADRYAGMIDLDKQEPEKANPPAETVAEEAGEQPVEAAEGTEEADPATEQDETQPDPWDGYEEIELDGKKLKIPTEAKEFLMKDADYRRKTQEVAERRRELEAREAQITERQQLTDEEIGAYVALTQVHEQLKEFEGINWNAELAAARAADDPIALADLTARYGQFQELRALQQGGQNFLNEAAKQRTAHANQETDKRIAATTDFARKNLTKLGWNEKVAGEVNAWMMNDMGFTVDTLKAAYSPQSYPLIYKAFLWDQSEKRQQSAKSTPVAPRAPATPTNVVSAKASPSAVPDLSKVSMAEYVRLRAAGKT